MDEKVEQMTADLQRRRYADNGLFYYGRNTDFDLKFTRKPKSMHAPYSDSRAFTDAGSFQSRKYFTRSDFVIQNPMNGGMQVRAQVPRIREASRMN